MKFTLVLILVLTAAGAYLAATFSASFYDLQYTLRRYSHCTGDLFPVRDCSLNETEYLVHQIRNFLDQGNYDHDQLANVSALMDNICRPDIDQSNHISVHIDVNQFSDNHTEGKANRCQAIDDALGSMFHVLKPAALNRSEPLDFSLIRFFPNAAERSTFYNLTDLINFSWIKSETILEHVCNITDSVKRYVQARQAAAAATSNMATSRPSVRPSSSSAMVNKRNEQQARVSIFTAIFDLVDRLLDPMLGLQKRLAWESNNRLEMVAGRLSSSLSSVGAGVGRGIRSTRERISSIFQSSNVTSSAKSPKLNTINLNATQFDSARMASSTTAAPAILGSSTPKSSTVSATTSVMVINSI